MKKLSSRIHNFILDTLLMPHSLEKQRAAISKEVNSESDFDVLAALANLDEATRVARAAFSKLHFAALDARAAVETARKKKEE